MKTIRTIFALSLLFLLAASYQIRASHVVGGYITYDYMGPNQYLLTFIFYRDCAGIVAPGSADICYQSASAGLSGTVTLNPIPGTGNEIQPYPCFTAGISACQGGSALGVQEWVYQGVATLPQAAVDWVFSWETCCRNAFITTLTNAPGVGIYVSAKLDNFTYPVNSSPHPSSLHYAQFCLNTLSTYSLPCTDADGDSIAYSLEAAEDGTFCPAYPTALAYNPSFSPTNPISSSTPITFDPVTGTLTFTPSNIQIGVICMLVKEYRNGVLIGEVKRDDMVFITNGVINPNWMKGKVFIDQNANAVYDTGEPEMQGEIIEVQPGSYYGGTNLNGDYGIPLPPGGFIATLPNAPLYYVATPPFNIASFTGNFQTDSINDFALSAPYNVQDLRVVLTGNNNVLPGNNINLNVMYANVGITTISSSVNLVHDTNYVFISSLPTPDNIAGNMLTWNFSNLLPSTSDYINVQLGLPATVPLATPLTSYAEILPVTGDSVPYDNSDTLHQTAAVPLDPNGKIVEPSGPITTTQVSAGTYLEYTIYFQNTGTAPAINVSITDTLDQNFNIPTFEVLSASHNYTWDIAGQGIVEFTFSNIMLPDSGTNELLSHGFIKYRIKPKNNLVPGDKVANTAYIVFDNNAPLATNSTSTTVINPVSVSELASDILDLLVYPNPANDLLNIEIRLREAGSLNIQLFNLVGETVAETRSIAQTGLFRKQLSVKSLSNGIYFLKIATANGMNVLKIVKN